jgi:hypothetical protein
MKKGKPFKRVSFQSFAVGFITILACFHLLGCSQGPERGETSSTPAPVTYFVAVDVSGSMQTNKLNEWILPILATLIQEVMNPEDKVIIYRYASTCEKEFDGHAKWEDIARLAKKLRTKTSPEKGTNPALPLEMIINNAPQDTRFAIILITDGEIANPERLQTAIKNLSERRNLSAILAGPLNSNLNLRKPFEEHFKVFNETSQKRFFSFGNQANDFDSALYDFKKAIQR